MGTESRLSVIWFPESERATATAMAVTANGFGTTFGFLLGPYIATSSDKIPYLLAVEIGIAAIPFLGSILFFPARPVNPPSAAAEALLAEEEGGDDGAHSSVDHQTSVGYLEGLSLCSENHS